MVIPADSTPSKFTLIRHISFLDLKLEHFVTEYKLNNPI